MPREPLIPFSPLPPQVLWPIVRSFKGIGNFLSALFPFLRDDIVQACINVPANEWATAAAVVSVANFILLNIVFFLVGIVAKESLLFPGLVLSLLLSIASFATIMFMPQIQAKKRQKQIDAQLIPAVRQLLIEVRSGVPLFHSVASISDEYGETSKEFKRLVSRIDAGISEVDALAEATRQTPSLQMRKLFWQLSNALKVGTDVGGVLEGLLKEFTAERVNDIRRYGQELLPWTMIYMMAGIIVPSLGITMLIVISSFMGITLPSFILPAGLIYLIVFQLFFMNFIGTRRPSI